MKYSLVALQSQTAFFILPQQRRDSNWMEQWTLDNNWEIEKWIKVNMDNDWIEIKIHTFLIANHLIHFSLWYWREDGLSWFCVITWYDFHVGDIGRGKIKKFTFIQKRSIWARKSDSWKSISKGDIQGALRNLYPMLLVDSPYSRGHFEMRLTTVGTLLWLWANPSDSGFSSSRPEGFYSLQNRMPWFVFET